MDEITLNQIEETLKKNLERVKNAPYYSWDRKNMLLTAIEESLKCVKTLRDNERYFNDEEFLDDAINKLTDSIHPYAMEEYYNPFRF